MNFPPQIVAGDIVKWSDTSQVGDLSSSIESGSYTLTYALRGASSLDVVGVASGTGWQFTINGAATAAWTAGVYYWQATATDAAGNRVTLGQGTFKVLPNIAAAVAGYDGTTQSEKDLAAVEQEIRNRIQGGASIEYSIGQRSLKRESLSELRAMRAELKRIVMKERQAQMIAEGRGNPRQVFVSFGMPFIPRP